MYDLPETLQCMWPFGCDKMAEGYDHSHATPENRAKHAARERARRCRHTSIARCEQNPAWCTDCHAWVTE